ncbi:MAG: hypothetical protein WA115_05435 [Polynucleobacter sp.]
MKSEYRVVTITQGNINNNHIYLLDAWDLIPKDSVGGENSDFLAKRLLDVHLSTGAHFKTDVAEDKKIFRARSNFREFFMTHKITDGSRLVIEKTGPYEFHIYPLREDK